MARHPVKVIGRSICSVIIHTGSGVTKTIVTGLLFGSGSVPPLLLTVTKKKSVIIETGDAGNGAGGSGGSGGSGSSGNGHSPIVEGKEKKAVPQPADITTVLKLVTVPLTCALTPIMLNRRMIAIRELGRREDMPRENFLDTCLYHVFKHWGFTLQDYYKKQKEAEGVDSPGGAGEKDGSNSNKAEYDEKELKMAVQILEFLKQIRSEVVVNSG
ncbi:MAG: hypothetical protein HY529_01855 [Chloroflexi bacterium]|nr:hypothetical protein [Chloroflexota bacterium]